MIIIVLLIIILSIITFDSFIFEKCNKFKNLQHHKSNKPKVVIVGSIHGNEPAGSHAIIKLNQLIKQKQIILKRGNLILLPFFNSCGHTINSRNFPSLSNSIDLNRSFYSKKGNFTMIEKLKKIVTNADMVLDLHEGWGYNVSDKRSLGSGIYPNRQRLNKLCQHLKRKLNNNIPNTKKQFVTKPLPPEMDNQKTLSNYCLNKNINHILIETTGQNDVQHLSVRQNQNLNVFINLFKKMKMI